ncbi:MAG: SIS domain-containing protein [Rhodospirillales bacterium]|nr:SIS domain-containing protein [Rhodospirillales bacterium]
MRETLMLREAREAPAAVARLLAQEGAALAALGRRLALTEPAVLVTCARGSSDHAAAYLKYLVEIATGVPVASIGPSVASVYGARLRLRGAVLVSVSQSGRSPDIVAFQAAARAAGALTVAIVNATDGALAQEAEIVIPLHAGAELSVAATKSFLSSAAAAAALVAGWSGDAALGDAVRGLPAALDRALECDWSAAAAMVAASPSLYLLGRGPGTPVAQEAALKAKEVAAIHAEAFSLAEVMHGPLRLIQRGFPVLGLVPQDVAAAANRAALARIAAAGGTVFTAAAAGPGTLLPIAATGHGLLDPLAIALSYYRFIEGVSRMRGLDPDHPTHLRKVTETL